LKGVEISDNLQTVGKKYGDFLTILQGDEVLSSLKHSARLLKGEMFVEALETASPEDIITISENLTAGVEMPYFATTRALPEMIIEAGQGFRDVGRLK
jgi:hypothetical protein